MVLQKKKVKPRAPIETMSFTIDTSQIPRPKAAPSAEKTKVLKRKSENRRSYEDVEAVDASKDKLRRLKNKNKKAARSTTAPHNREQAEVVELKKKTKPKKPGTDLVIPASMPMPALAAPGQKKISKLNKKDLVSIMGDDAEEMQALFEEDNTDQAVRLLNRRLIQTCIDLIPQLETGIRSSNGRYGVHSLNGTIQTIRELVIDLQSMQDRGAIGESIVEKIIRPTILEMATKIVEESATVLSEVKDLIPSEVYSRFRQAQLDSKTRLAGLMDEKYRYMREETVKFLQR